MILTLMTIIDHWEISRTFKTYCNASLDINTNENSFQIVSGPNQVLIDNREKSYIQRRKRTN